MCFDYPEERCVRGPIHPEDVLCGATVGPNGDRAFCQSCRRELRSGMACTVYAYRLVDTPAWDIARLHCPTCAPTRIEAPTLGAVEILADARLATQSRPDTQQHRLCLVEPGVAAYAGPETGAEA